MPAFRRSRPRHGVGQPSTGAPLRPAHPPSAAPPALLGGSAPDGPRAAVVVGLYFADGTSVGLTEDDPRTRAFRLVAQALTG